MFSSVLVANRGEIAVRISRTLRKMGIRSVVVASIPDRNSLAVRTADDWVLLEGYSATETYLDIGAVIAAAREKGCEAIHPGYGFLSERAQFAEACAAAGLTFIGPTPDVLRALGDKAAARQFAVANGVPVVPGYDGPDDDEILARQAARIGFPLMVKARGGGGGRGMREVHHPANLDEALQSARREAEAAFGDPGLLLEKLVTNAHHVEVQVLGDQHGNLVHLGERDCSVQRRRQKLIEETPSPVVDDTLRAELTGAALRLARAVNYTNAGTVEFLVGEPGEDGRRPFYFLEVNPRLQVEHPVTEMVTGLDLVELQVRIAAGEPLPFAQGDIQFSGHAIEFRINAEDPWDNFKPSAGRIHVSDLAEPGFLRSDTGFLTGDSVPAQYDSLLAKVVVHGESRDLALVMAADVGEVAFEPLVTNAPLLAAIVAHPDFRAGRHHIAWLERELVSLLAEARPPVLCIAAAGLAAAQLGDTSPFRQPPVAVAVGWPGGRATVQVERLQRGLAIVAVDGEQHRLRIVRASDTDLTVETSPDGTRANVYRDEGRYFASCEATQPLSGRYWAFKLVPPPPLPRRAQATAAGATLVTAPLAGTIATVNVAEGDEVEPGQLLLTLEAMKMEHRITATAAGTVAHVTTQPGAVVAEGDPLIELA